MLRKIIIALVIVILVLALFLRSYLRGGMPDHEGELKVKGISGEVNIIRDGSGIPHIQAYTEADAYYGLGYAMAQDRLFQMEFLRAAANGSLSEILGEDLLKTDIFLRKLMLRSKAPEKILDRYPLEIQTMIHSFIAGINQFILEDHRLPLEFRLLDHAPLLWDEGDILALTKLQSWDLSYNYDQEIIYRDIVSKVGLDKARTLFPYYGRKHFKLLSERELGPDQLEELLTFSTWLHEFVGLDGGSNNWVISGDRTASGKPILASDPHLGGSRLPGPWYFAHLQAPGLDVAGGCFAGLPLVLIGHNRAIAWGVTNMGPDVQDLYIEEVNPDDEDQYLYKESWRRFDLIPQEIRVKDPDAEDGFRKENLLIRKSLHGPVMHEDEQVLALAWTGHRFHDEVITFYEINHAANREEFIAALSHFGSAPQNFVFADTSGDIGYYGAGKVPMRGLGDGLLPVPGWTGQYDWISMIPFEHMPHLFNPEEGFIATANAQPVSDFYAYRLPGVYAPDFRTLRIRSLLAGQEATDLSEQMENQLDQKSLLAAVFLDHLLPLLEDDEYKQALKNWDHVVSAESGAAALYHEIMDRFLRSIWHDELGEELANNYVNTWYISLNRWVKMMDDPENEWFDNVETDTRETRDDLLRMAFSNALESLSTQFGTAQVEAWYWGQGHDIEFHHPFEAKGGLIRKYLNYGPFPFGGDGETVNRATYDFHEPYRTVMTASMRMLVDMSVPGRSKMANASGQVGVPKHEHYTDLIDDWLAGDYLTMSLDIDDLSGEQKTLVLKPK